MLLSLSSSKSPPGVLVLSLSISETASASKALSAMRRNLIELSKNFKEVLEIFNTIDIVLGKTTHSSHHRNPADVALRNASNGRRCGSRFSQTRSIERRSFYLKTADR
uniref:Uncharacterized protein n=1 Tax=Romanomermis culicivorax TaxID=13658 RepID=A0A915IWV7_ROMCU